MIQNFFSHDDFYFLRKHMHDFVCSQIHDHLVNNTGLTVLEVGPSGTYDNNTPFPEFDTSSKIKDFCEKYNHEYLTLDIIEKEGINFVGSISCLCDVVDRKVDVIIALSVLEHVPDLFDVPKQLDFVLNENGLVFLNTPLMFKVHGPIPDCWRLTQYGYQKLFGSFFHLNFFAYPEGQLGKNSTALSINVVGKKK